MIVGAYHRGANHNRFWLMVDRPFKGVLHGFWPDKGNVPSMRPFEGRTFPSFVALKAFLADNEFYPIPLEDRSFDISLLCPQAGKRLVIPKWADCFTVDKRGVTAVVRKLTTTQRQAIKAGTWRFAPPPRALDRFNSGDIYL